MQGLSGSSRRPQNRANRANRGEFLDRTLPYKSRCRKIIVLAPESGLRLRIFCAPGAQKEPYWYARFRAFFAREMWPTDSLCKKKNTILFGKRRPQVRHLPIFGKRTRGNSALHRSYITNSDGEWKNVKISVLGNIGFGAQTTRQLLQTFLVNFWGSGPPKL